jgi:hypothetical protein
MSFNILFSYIILNLFIAIILNGYFETRDQDEQVLSPDLLSVFQDSWSHFDQDGTGYIKSDDFKQFLFDLGPPLGWDSYQLEKPERQDRYIALFTQLNPERDL